jgi:hypothetical protein
MNPQSVVEIFNAIKPEIWIMFFKGIGIAVVLLILKNINSNLSSYFMFRTNKNIGKNVKLKFNGRDAMITGYDWRFIYIKYLDTDTEALVHITTWQKQRWEVYKNGFHKKTEDK